MLHTRQFGRLGHQSTNVIFGAAALGAMSQSRADATLEAIDAAGVNHIDTAASYGDSEDRLKPFLATHRDRYFLATKTGHRDGQSARTELERSLERMGVDHVDLIQLHNLVEPDEWQTAHAPGGALEALIAARDEGLVRGIGVTGHGTRIPAMHLRSLDAFDYDSVLFPYNWTLMQRPDYRESVTALRQRCNESNVAMQTIKSIARGRWADDYDGPRYSWYEPLRDPDAIDRAVRYVLGTHDLFLNTTSDGTLLPLVLAAADRVDGASAIVAPSDDEMAADTDAFGVTELFDGAALERM